MPKETVYDEPEGLDLDHDVRPQDRPAAADPKVSSPAEPPYTPPPKTPVFRKPAFPIGLIGGLALIGAVAFFAWLHYHGRESTDNAQVDGDILPVSSRVNGTIAEVLVQENQTVKAGDVLVRIDPRDLQARVDQARAALQYAESQARAAGAGVPLTTETTASGTSEATAALNAAQADAEKARIDAERAGTALVQAAAANVQQAQANYDKAQADLARMRPLVAKEEISRQQFDAYVAAARVAQGQLTASQENLRSAQQDAAQRRAGAVAAQARVAQARAGVESSRANQGQVQVTQAQAASARAGVEQARANLAAAELQLSYANIVAAADGKITRKVAEVGQTVQPGQALMMLVPTNRIWVTANFKETQLKNVRVGQKAEIKVDLSDRKYEGHVESLAQATGSRMSMLPPENATGNFVKVVQRIPVRIFFDNLPKDAYLAPGMNVEATIFVQ